MKFVKVDDWQPGIDALAARLHKELQAGNRVLWLVPGGSNIKAAVSIMNTIPDELTERLAILLTDERFGRPGHKDSNYKQLQDAGFGYKQANFMPTLVEGLNLMDTVHRYEELLGHAIAHANVVVGQFGIGSDGHIAGILPHSAASTSAGMAYGYEASPYIRITMTFEALTQLDVAYALVFGDDKHAALHRLQAEQLTLQEQPSQVLKHLPEAYIYNDQIGEDS